MKKVSDAKYLTDFQRVFLDESYVDPNPSSLTAFEQESFYQIKVQENLDIKKLFNKSYGDIFYAKKNKKNKIILPDLQYITNMSFAKGNMSALVFVADAYRDLIRDWDSLNRRGLSSEKNKLDITPSMAYVNFENFYQLKIIKYFAYIETFFKAKNTNNIKNIKSFLKNASEAVSKMSISNPFTITNFIESKYCPDNISGLVITTNIQVNNNYTDRSNLINSKDFNFYNNLAIKYGFAIDKNNPKNLYFNIYSPAAQKYILKYLPSGKTVKDSFHNTFFIESEQYDLYYIQKYFIFLYNMLVDIFPTTSEIVEKKCKTGNRLETKITERKKVTVDEEQEILNSMADYDWWKFFIYIKFCELNIDVDNKIFNIISEKSFQIYESLDIQESIRYISLETKNLPRSKSGQRNFSY